MSSSLRALAVWLALISGAEGAEVTPPATVAVPAGPFIQGSDRDEREAAYRLDERAYGHEITRRNRWYESEPARRTATLPAFAITRGPITNGQYAAFIKAAGHRAPDVGPIEWADYRLIHPFSRRKSVV